MAQITGVSAVSQNIIHRFYVARLLPRAVLCAQPRVSFHVVRASGYGIVESIVEGVLEGIVWHWHFLVTPFGAWLKVSAELEAHGATGMPMQKQLFSLSFSRRE